jgi:hypothetical protein
VENERAVIAGNFKLVIGIDRDVAFFKREPDETYVRFI